MISEPFLMSRELTQVLVNSQFSIFNSQLYSNARIRKSCNAHQ